MLCSYTRDFIKSELANAVFEKFPEAEVIAGVATAGIAWGAMVADQLKLPYIYVRPKPKEHGLGNQIEGFYKPLQKVVVLEDLVTFVMGHESVFKAMYPKARPGQFVASFARKVEGVEEETIEEAMSEKDIVEVVDAEGYKGSEAKKLASELVKIAKG